MCFINEVNLFFVSTGLNPLPFDPATNNEPLQFSSSNGPLVPDCPLENGTENSKKRKRPNLPPGRFLNFNSVQSHSILQSLTTFTLLILAITLFMTFKCGLRSLKYSHQMISFIKRKGRKPQEVFWFFVGTLKLQYDVKIKRCIWNTWVSAHLSVIKKDRRLHASFKLR